MPIAAPAAAGLRRGRQRRPPGVDHAVDGSAPSASRSRRPTQDVREVRWRRRRRRHRGRRHRHAGAQARGQHIECERGGQRIARARIGDRRIGFGTRRPARTLSRPACRCRSAPQRPKAMRRRSSQYPAGDPVRPQQAGTGERDPDDQQPSAGTAGQQKSKRIGADQLAEERCRPPAGRPAPPRSRGRRPFRR